MSAKPVRDNYNSNMTFTLAVLKDILLGGPGGRLGDKLRDMGDSK